MAVLNYFEKGLEMSYRVLPKSSAWVTKSVCDVFAYFPPYFKGQLWLVFHGSGWVFMVFHSSRLIFHGSRLVFHGSRLDFHGSRLVFHGFMLVSGRFQWDFMVPGWFLMVLGWF